MSATDTPERKGNRMTRIISIVAAVIAIPLGAVVLIGNPVDAGRLLAIGLIAAGSGLLAAVV